MPENAHLKVLVVDDNVDSAESLALLLQMEGYEVVCAHDGTQAVASAASFDPDAVLLDLGLPDFDGFEVARRLRAAEGSRRRLLVALTGFGREQDRSDALAAGFDLHLTKPVDPDVVIGVLRGDRQR